MGLILDTSLLSSTCRDFCNSIQPPAHDRRHYRVRTSSRSERAQDAAIKARRHQRIEKLLAAIFVIPFDLFQARTHARIWAELASRGQIIGAHDLQIAAAGVALGHEVATLNIQEFQRVAGLKIADATGFRIT